MMRLDVTTTSPATRIAAAPQAAPADGGLISIASPKRCVQEWAMQHLEALPLAPESRSGVLQLLRLVYALSGAVDDSQPRGWCDLSERELARKLAVPKSSVHHWINQAGPYLTVKRVGPQSCLRSLCWANIVPELNDAAHRGMIGQQSLFDTAAVAPASVCESGAQPVETAQRTAQPDWAVSGQTAQPVEKPPNYIGRFVGRSLNFSSRSEEPPERDIKYLSLGASEIGGGETGRTGSTGFGRQLVFDFEQLERSVTQPIVEQLRRLPGEIAEALADVLRRFMPTKAGKTSSRGKTTKEREREEAQRRAQFDAEREVQFKREGQASAAVKAEQLRRRAQLEREHGPALDAMSLAQRDELALEAFRSRPHALQRYSQVRGAISQDVTIREGLLAGLEARDKSLFPETPR